MDRFARVTHFSTGISMAACLAMALSGYLTFGSFTQGNVLNNFPTDNIMVNIARLYVSYTSTLSIPLPLPIPSPFIHVVNRILLTPGVPAASA